MYLDTSVLVAYYCPEALSDKVQRVLNGLTEPTISPLVELELYSALGLKVRTREIDTATAGHAATMFEVHLADDIYRVVPIGAREYKLSRDWLSKFNSTLRTLDALHLAAALANDLTLISADRSMIRCAKQLSVKHQLIA
jgi:hypothetical protein